ncbi:MAG: hypothetical protein KJO70_01430 [Gammaproteobacteria bacterium]|nr:hypothetical protein [Gammaproteobacteria bacterium]NNJ77954.1 hypothetical protein [Xanthomonadales bacterium]
MPRIVAKGDNLNELNAQFEQQPLREPVFLNSVPKCGTHLFRNIVRMFVPVKQQYHRAFIQIPVLHQHLGAFTRARPMLSWGHLLFTDSSAIALQGVRHTVLVRDPYTWVLARARFFLSDTFQGQMDHLKGGRVSVEEVLNMMIFGIYDKAPPMLDIYMHNAAAWMGTDVTILKMEELVAAVRNLESDGAESYFRKTMALCGIDPLPEDWRERVRVGSDRKQSGTARENLAGQAADVPDELPDTQKKLVDFAIPGIRELLGYA